MKSNAIQIHIILHLPDLSHHPLRRNFPRYLFPPTPTVLQMSDLASRCHLLQKLFFSPHLPSRMERDPEITNSKYTSGFVQETLIARHTVNVFIVNLYVLLSLSSSLQLGCCILS